MVDCNYLMPDLYSINEAGFSQILPILIFSTKHYEIQIKLGKTGDLWIENKIIFWQEGELAGDLKSDFKELYSKHYVSRIQKTKIGTGINFMKVCPVC